MKTLPTIFQKLRILSLCLIVLLLSGQLYGQESFVHQATPANITGHVTTLDHPSLNGKSGAIVFATHDYGQAGPYYTHAYGVYYASGRWRIFSQNRLFIPANTKFNVLVMNASANNAFVHTVSKSNSNRHITSLSHPLLDQDTSAVVIITQNWGTLGPYNPHHVGVYYNSTSKKWAIFNQDLAALPLQAKFNVLVLPQKKRVKINQAFMVGLKINGVTATNSHIAHLNHPTLNNQPNLTLLTTPHWGILGPYNNNPTGVWYDGKQWAVYNENIKSMPRGVKFHVLRIEKNDEPFQAVVSSTNLYLDKVIYPARSTIRAELHLDQVLGAISLTNPYILLAAPKSKDVEYVKLIPTTKPGVYQTEVAIPTQVHLTTTPATSLNGTLSLRPGEMFYAIYSPRERAADAGSLDGTDMIYDFGVAAERAGSVSAVKVIPELALTEDEKSPEPGQKPLATLTTKEGLPIQVALNELIIYPLNQQQLDRFLAKTQGTIIDQYIPSPNTPYELQSAYLVRVNLNRVNAGALSQLRATWGMRDTLFASKPDAFKLVQLALESLLDGYAIGLNPRVLPMDEAYLNKESTTKPIAFAEPNFDGERLTASFTDSLFSIPRVWAFMALFDKDQARIPVAFLDQGFSPNADFRRPFFAECNLEGGDRCGPGAATGPPTVNNSFFFGRSWHGNGVVSVAGGVINNNFGVGGTGGQVVVPGLYRFGTVSYAFEIGKGIRKATADGANIINISAGYPCRILTNILGWTPGICGVGERGLFCATVTAGLATANALICASAAALAAIPIVGPILAIPAAIACAHSTVALATASGACFTTLIAGDVRGVMEDGVNFALSQGVTVVASAGNKLAPEDLPPVLRDIINLDPRRQTVGEWQPIPAIIPGVICVGATDNFTPFANRQVFGSRVDIWAPIRSNYFAPSSLDDVAAPQRVVPGGFGGTSAAAPYICGLIANMQAINPTLNPRTPGLSATTISGIPRRIRDLLVNTAFTNDELDAMGHTDPNGDRGNLVNPMRLITRASLGIIPDFAARGYNNSLNFGGVELVPDDTQERAQEVFATRDSLFTGTIITFPGTPTISDLDWYVWKTPSSRGIYRDGFVELTFPSGFGNLVVNNDLPAPVSVRNLGDETIKRYAIPDLSRNSQFAIRVSGDRSGSDNIYKLSFHAATRDPLGLLADRFDTPGGNNNLASRNNNNTARAATLLGTNGLLWESGTGYSPLLFPLLPAPGHEIKVANLNFHTGTDADWFSFDIAPPIAGRGTCLPPMIRIKANPNVFIELLNAEEQLLEGRAGEITTSIQYVRRGLPTEVKFFRLRPVVPGSPVAYNLGVIYERPSIDFCNIGGGIAFQDATEKLNSKEFRELVIYPNPTKGSVTLKVQGLPFESGQQVQVIIYNPQGSPVLQRPLENGELQVNLTGQLKGIYFVRLLVNGQELMVQKLMYY